jgi:RimJ/RimL family protein N-acetyltransferase
MSNTPPPPHHPVPIIRAERIYLRPAERTDLDTFVRWFADADTTEHLSLRAPFSGAMEEQWFSNMVEQQGKTAYHFVICLADDGRAIGTTGFHKLDLENGNAEFGIVIGEKAEWSKGYGTEALQAMCDFGFGQLRLERIELEVYDENVRARRSYEKAGFTLEGTLRRGHFSNGRYHDVRLMAQLRDEWLALERTRSWEYGPDR